MQPDALFTIEGSGVHALKDVEGKKVATATFLVFQRHLAAHSQVEWRRAESKVTLLKVDPEALAPMLASGEADAIISWTTSATLRRQASSPSRGGSSISCSGPNTVFEGYGYSLLASE